MRKPDAADYLMAPVGFVSFVAVIFGFASGFITVTPYACQDCFDPMINAVESMARCGKESC